MKRKLSFYIFGIKNKNTYEQVENFKDIIFNIINVHSVKNGNIRTLSLAKNDDDPVSIDVLDEEGEFLFCRIGHKKDLTTVIKRNRETRKSENILSDDEIPNKDIESSTYFLLDFEYGFIAYVVSQGAPRIDKLSLITDIYTPDMMLDIKQIADPERVESLLKEGSVLSSIEYSFPVPSVEVLTGLGLDAFQIAALSESDIVSGRLIIKAEPKKPLSKVSTVISSIVNSFKGKAQESQILFHGKEPNNKTQPYRFGDDFVNYQVELPTTKTENHTKVPLSLDTQVLIARKNIISIYKANRENLQLYAGKI